MLMSYGMQKKYAFLFFSACIHPWYSRALGLTFFPKKCCRPLSKMPFFSRGWGGAPRYFLLLKRAQRDFWPNRAILEPF